MHQRVDTHHRQVEVFRIEPAGEKAHEKQTVFCGGGEILKYALLPKSAGELLGRQGGLRDDFESK